MQLHCTAIVLVHQDTPILWQCLASLSLFEKVLVIDSGSQIDTNSLKRAGVTDVVTIQALITNFAEVRNQAMHHCTTPWCFFLDSDEVLDPQDSSVMIEIESMFRDNSLHGITVKRSDVFLQQKLQYGEAGNQALIRFMRPDQTRWEGAAHEVPTIPGSVHNSVLTISHYSHESINSFIDDVSKYAKIVATQKQSSRIGNLAQLICFPPLKLVYDLFLLGGILDGWRGVIYSYCMALHSLLVRIYWYEKHASLAPQPNTATSK